MDVPGAIAYLASSEARRARPVRLEEAAAGGLPFFDIRRRRSGGGGGGWEVRCGGHVGHDNASRLPFLCDWLSRRVLPLVDPDADISGAYRIELHDSYAYLPERRLHPERYDHAFTFARPTDARETMALMPDAYQIQGLDGLLDARDDVPWAAKRPTLFFAGTTTGDRDPARNERIAACLWARAHAPPDVARFSITSIAQMDPDRALAAVPGLRAVMGPYVSLEEHRAHRYQVNLAGNTACWSRVPMVLASRSLLVHVRHPDALWYYPLLRDGVHYVGVEAVPDLLKARDECEADPARCQRIVQDANRFANDVLRPRHADAYMAVLLETCAWRGGK